MTYRLQEDPRVDKLHSLLLEHASELPATVFALKSRALPIGIVISILRWTAYNAPNGDLSIYAPSVIADAIEWEYGPELLMRLLREAGFLDERCHFLNLDEMFASKKMSIEWMDGE
jgi:hypothetical protein